MTKYSFPYLNHTNYLKGEGFFFEVTTSSCGAMIGYFGNKNLLVNKTSKDNNGRFLIIEAEIETEMFVFLSLYNSNPETEQLQTLSDGDLLIIDFSLVDTKTLIEKEIQFKR